MKGRGFTLIELLIAIVVIAILASISVVAYNGIQARANNSARLQQTANIMKLLKMYKTLHGDYPGVTAGAVRCIGTGYPEGMCGGTVGNYVPESNTELTAKLNSLGNTPSTQHPVGSGRGPYVHAWPDGWGFDVYIFMQGETADACPAEIPNLWYNDPNSDRIDCGVSISYSRQGGA